MLVGERIADGHDPFADAKRIRVAQRRIRQRPRRIDLDEGNVRVRVGANARRMQIASVRQPHHDPVRPVHDVMIRQDQTGGIDDEPRARAATRSLWIAIARAIEQLRPFRHRQATEAAAARAARGRIDVYDRRIETLRDIRKRHDRR